MLTTNTVRCKIRKTTLQCKLFTASLLTIVEAIYQIAYVMKVLKRFYMYCEQEYEESFLALSHYGFLHNPMCANETVMDFLVPNATLSFTPVQKKFFQQLEALGETESPKDFTVRSMLYLWQVLDVLLILSSFLLLFISFCTNAIGRKICKTIIFPWVALVSLTAISDMCSLVVVLYVYGYSRKATSWIVLIGFSKKHVENFRYFDQANDTALNDDLEYLPKRLILANLRHGFAVPMFIAFAIVIGKDTVALYRKKKRAETSKIFLRSMKN